MVSYHDKSQNNEDRDTPAPEMAPASLWRVVLIENPSNGRDCFRTRDQNGGVPR